MGSYLWTMVGMVAGVCTTACFVPQVWKIWREADTDAISKRMYMVLTTAFGLWIVHGVMIGSIPIIVFNVLNLLLRAVTLVMKIRSQKGAVAG